MAQLLAPLVALGLVAALATGCGGDEGAGDVVADDNATPTSTRPPGAEGAGGPTETFCLPPECGTTLPAVVTDGYVGPEPSPNATSDAAVDGASVVTPAEGEWWAQGLVVNGDAPLGGSPVVRATLAGRGGVALGVVEAPLLVVPLRPGEPSPFRVEAPGVAATEVANVSWAVVGGEVGGEAVTDPAAGRSLELSVAWSRPAGGDAVTVPGYADGGGAGSPLVTYVTTRNTGVAPLGSPQVVAAWVDGRGRVLGLATADVLAPGTSNPLGVLDPGGVADAVVVLGPPAADGLGSFPPLLWGVGR